MVTASSAEGLSGGRWRIIRALGNAVAGTLEWMVFLLACLANAYEIRSELKRVARNQHLSWDE